MLLRRTLSATFTALLLFNALILGLDVQPARGSNIVVPDDYPTIQMAVNAASAGDTVFVRSSTYHETVCIGKSISLIGADKQTTIIDAVEGAPALKVNANGVLVKGFKLESSGYEYETGKSEDFAIAYFGGSNNIFSDLILEGRARKLKGSWLGGIHMENCTNTTIKNSLLIDFRGDGIQVTKSGGNVFCGNVINYTWWGISFRLSSNNVVKDNIIAYTASSHPSPYHAIGGKLENFFAPAGIAIYYDSQENHVIGNEVTNCAVHGVSIGNSSTSNVIADNIVLSNGIYHDIDWGNYDVFVDGSSIENKFYHNSFNNSTMIHTESEVNAWDNDYPSGGNYWSNYVGVDLFSGYYQNETGRDGMGDTPFIIDDINRDNYPLKGPWTRSGENVTVALTTTVALTFANVTEPGITTVTLSLDGPDLPSDFEPVVNPPNYYDIETKANCCGTVRIAIQFDDAGLTQGQERGLSLLHWNEGQQHWTDITIFVDTVNDMICGEAGSLSVFVILISNIYSVGDINKDRAVDIFDIVLVALAFGSSPGNSSWSPNMDINSDSIIDIFDIVLVALHLNETG